MNRLWRYMRDEIDFLADGNPWLALLWVVLFSSLAVSILGLLAIPLMAALISGFWGALWIYLGFIVFSFVTYKAISWEKKHDRW